ncbi:helix-turn-helix domain-containing protein [Acidaminobacterium chupaoyuni]
MRRGVSEYQLGYDLGHSRGYIYNISSGKSLPALSELFSICDYFGITPCEFLDDKLDNPELVQKAMEGLRQLSDEDVLLMLSNINRLLKNNVLRYSFPSKVMVMCVLEGRLRP